MQFGGHRRSALGDVHVDLGPHAEVSQVDSRLDGDANSWNQMTGVVRLPAVQINGVAVDLGAEAVTEPMTEVGSIASTLDVVTCDTVDLTPLDGTADSKACPISASAASLAPATTANTS